MSTPLRTTPILTEPQHGEKYRNSHGRQQPIQPQRDQVVSFSKSDHVAYDQKQGALDPAGRGSSHHMFWEAIARLLTHRQVSRPTANLTAFREALRFCHRPFVVTVQRLDKLLKGPLSGCICGWKIQGRKDFHHTHILVPGKATLTYLNPSMVAALKAKAQRKNKPVWKLVHSCITYGFSEAKRRGWWRCG